MERFAAAARFYERIGYKNDFFSVCNDATAVRAAVTCRLQDNALLGLATLRDLRCGATMQSIEDVALEHGIATNVDVYLLNPLDPMLPSFVLGVFPQSDKKNLCIFFCRCCLKLALRCSPAIRVRPRTSYSPSSLLCAKTLSFFSISLFYVYWQIMHLVLLFSLSLVVFVFFLFVLVFNFCLDLFRFLY